MFCVETIFRGLSVFFFFFFNDTATTEIYTLSLHDALPISGGHDRAIELIDELRHLGRRAGGHLADGGDRKSTRLNSSHSQISYAVFCLKKKKKKLITRSKIPRQSREPVVEDQRSRLPILHR